MAYRFRPREPFPAGFVRIGLEQIERARARLASADDGSGAGVHEARKSLKRIRSLLRLVRPALGTAVFRAENARFRDIARLLAGARDRDVLLATLEAMRTDATGRDADALASLRHQASGLPHGGGHGGTTRAEDLAAAASQLTQAAPAWAALVSHDMDPHSMKTGAAAVWAEGVWSGLARASQEGRQWSRRIDAAGDAGADGEAAHEYRKSVQIHWRHMALLRRAWPEEMSARLDLARGLSQVLGDEHDLEMVTAFALTHSGRDDRRRVVRLAAARQAELRAQALPMGRLLFAEKGEVLARRIAAYWETEATRPARVAARGAAPPVATSAARGELRDAAGPGTGRATPSAGAPGVAARRRGRGRGVSAASRRGPDQDHST